MADNIPKYEDSLPIYEDSLPINEDSLPINESSDIEDTLRGLAQGASLRFSDELVGAGEATTDKLKSLFTGEKAKDWLDLYRQHQKESEAANKASQERSPWLYGGGEMLGAGGTAALTAGAGIGVGAGARAGVLAAEGLGLGLISGAGGSEGNLDTEEGVKQLAKDIAIEGGTGFIAGPVIGKAFQATGKVLGKASNVAKSKLNDILQEYPELRRQVLAFTEGKGGRKLVGQKGEDILEKQTKLKSKELSDDLINARDVLANQLGTVTEKATNKLDLGTDLLQSQLNLQQLGAKQKTLINDPFFDRFDNIIKEFQLVTNQGKTSSAKESFNLRQKLIDLKQHEAPPEINQLAQGLIEKVDSHLIQIPGYEQALNNLKQIPAQTGELFLTKTIQSYKNPSAQLRPNIRGNVIKAGKEGASETGKAARGRFTELFENLQKIEKEQPGLLESIGLDKLKTQKPELQKIGDITEARRLIKDPTARATSTSGIVKGVIGLPLGLGGATGEGKLLLSSNRLGKIASLSKKIFSLPEQGLRQVSDTLQQNGFNDLGQALAKSLDNKNQGLQNAILFKAIQLPQIRQLFNEEEEQAPTEESNIGE